MNAIWHSLHQTPISLAIRRTPLLSRVAHFLWHRHQTARFVEATTEFLQVFDESSLADASRRVPSVLTVDKENRNHTHLAREFSAQMRALCSADKFWQFGYELVYAQVVRELWDRNPRILEIGIGVADPSKPSGMPRDYIEGSSLIGWSRLLQGAELHGADIDKRVLVNTEHYAAHHVNQLSKPSLAKLAQDLGSKWDLVIDDGLHTPEANGNTIWAFLGRLSRGGMLVVEDILPSYDSLWRQLEPRLPNGFEMRFFPSSYLGGPSGMAVIARV